MAEYSGFFNTATGNAREYSDEDMARIFGLLAGSDGYVINYGDELEVTIYSGLSLLLGTGAAFLGYNYPGWYYLNDEAKSISIDSESTGTDRVDRIVLRVDRETTGLAVTVVVKKGTAAASNPEVPTITTDNATVYEMPIAQVYVTGGSTTPVITDERKPAVRDEARIKFITDDTRTLCLADNRKIIMANNASAISYTVPPEADAAFPIGAELVVIQYGAGAVTLVEGTGVNIRSGDDYLTTATQYKGFTLVKIASDEWLALGTEA